MFLTQEIFQTPLVCVHLYELLYRGGLKTGGPLKSKLTAMLPTLQALKTKYHKTATSYKRLPLYVRINTLIAQDPTSVVKQLKSQFPDSNFTGDPHVNFLIKFPAHTNFSQCKLYRKGSIMIQDKASCMPGVALNPPPSSNVIDACSAPGNKTLHVAALMGNSGTVFAVERDRKRFKRLSDNVRKHRATNISPICADFLKISPSDSRYADVTHILVDPSCSGSGMVTENLVNNFQSKNEEKIRKLSDLQKRLLRHALSFPRATRVVYSTCSVYKEENEGVVKETLESHSDNWDLTRVIPDWTRRGDTNEFAQADKCVRCEPQDETNGFFLACFVRKQKETDREFLGGVKIQNVFSLRHLLRRYRVKHHYKLPYKFIRV